MSVGCSSSGGKQAYVDAEFALIVAAESEGFAREVIGSAAVCAIGFACSTSGSKQVDGTVTVGIKLTVTAFTFEVVRPLLPVNAVLFDDMISCTIIDEGYSVSIR